jgi:uncharacterized Zn-finger protein
MTLAVLSDPERAAKITAGATAAAAHIAVQAAEISASATIGAAFIAALGVTVGGLFITGRLQKQRNRQDQESQWRSHAVELTKLEVDRLVKTRGPSYKGRPSILTFLAHYRDLQELNTVSPKELYQRIESTRITSSEIEPSLVASDADIIVVCCRGIGSEGHPNIFLKMTPGSERVCPYCSQKFVLPV